MGDVYSLYPAAPTNGLGQMNALQVAGLANSMLYARQQQINIANAQLGYNLNANQAAAGLFATLAANPNASMGDVYDISARLATLGIPGPIISGWVGRMSNGGPGQFKNNLAEANAYAMGPVAASARVTGPPGSGGEPTSMNAATAGAQGSYATGMAPGAAEALTANRAAYVNDQTKSAQTLANARQLEAALPLISQLGSSSFGPGSPQYANVRGALISMGLVGADANDPVTIRQELNKHLLRYAAGAQAAGRSDQALAASLGSNPNLDLTSAANQALLVGQLGMDRMDAAIPLAFAKSPMGADQGKYLSFKSSFYQNNDPRAFSFDKLSPDERISVLASVGFKNGAPPKPGSAQYGAWLKFGKSLDMAKSLGYFGALNGQ